MWAPGREPNLLGPLAASLSSPSCRRSGRERMLSDKEWDDGVMDEVLHTRANKFWDMLV